MPTKNAVYKGMKGWDQLEHMLLYLVPENKKRMIWRSVVRRALSLNRARIRRQENIDGTKFDQRADGGKQKMLTRTLRGAGKKGMSQVAVRSDENGAVLEQLNPVNKKQHYGFTKTVKAMSHEELEKARGDQNEYKSDFKSGKRKAQIIEMGTKAILKHGGAWTTKEAKCTKGQARYLKYEVGFKKITFDHGKTHVSATLKRLQKAFSMSEAGAIIRDYRIKQGEKPKSSWVIKVPPRDVLGLSPKDEKVLMEYLKVLIVKHSYFKDSMPAYGNAYQEWAEGVMRMA